MTEEKKEYTFMDFLYKLYLTEKNSESTSINGIFSIFSNLKTESSIKQNVIPQNQNEQKIYEDPILIDESPQRNINNQILKEQTQIQNNNIENKQVNEIKQFTNNQTTQISNQNTIQQLQSNDPIIQNKDELKNNVLLNKIGKQMDLVNQMNDLYNYLQVPINKQQEKQKNQIKKSNSNQKKQSQSVTFRNSNKQQKQTTFQKKQQSPLPNEVLIKKVKPISPTIIEDDSIDDILS